MAGAFLRKSAARDQTSLFVAIASALNAETARDAVGWFATSGYNLI